MVCRDSRFEANRRFNRRDNWRSSWWIYWREIVFIHAIDIYSMKLDGMTDIGIPLDKELSMRISTESGSIISLEDLLLQQNRKSGQ